MGSRFDDIPGFNIDRVAAAAGDDPDVLRLENLDTDLPPPAAAIEATRAAVGEDDANSWLPFTGRDDLKEAVAAYVERRGGAALRPAREIVITCGEGDAMLDALLLPHRSGRRGRPHRPDLRRHAQPRPARRRGAAARPAARRRRRMAARPRRAARGGRAERTRVVFLNNAVVPDRAGSSSDEEWEAVAALCRERDLLAALLGRLRGRRSSTAGRCATRLALAGHARADGDRRLRRRSSSG